MAKKESIKLAVNREVKSAQVNLRVSESLLHDIDELRVRLGMNRNEFLEALIRFGIRDNRWIIKAVTAFVPFGSPAKVKDALG